MKKIQLFFFYLIFAVNAQAQTWKAQTLPGNDLLSIFDISIVNDTVAWAATWHTTPATPYSVEFSPSGRIYHTINGGTSWTASKIQGISQLIGNIMGIDATTAFVPVHDYALGNFLYKTTDGGISWTETSPPMNDSSFILTVYFFTPTRGIVLGDPRDGYFEIYQTTNAGQTWTRVPRTNIPEPLSGEFAYTGSYAVEGLNIWFPTNLGRIYRSIDGGNNWQVSEANITQEGFIALAKNMVGLAASSLWDNTRNEFSTTLSRSLDSGKTWVDAIPTNNKFACLSLSAIPESNYFVMTGGSNYIGSKYTWLSRDSGKTWMVIDTVEGIYSTEFIRANDPKKGVSGIIGYGGIFNSGKTIGSIVRAKIFSYNGIALTGLLTHSVLDAQISLSPNPTSEQINIQLTYKEPSNFRLNINNISGDLVYFEDFEDVSTINKSLDITHFPAGTYILTIANRRGSLSRKLVKIE